MRRALSEDVQEIRLLMVLVASQEGLGLLELHALGPTALDVADRLVAKGDVVRSDGPLFEISRAGRDRFAAHSAPPKEARRG